MIKKCKPIYSIGMLLLMLGMILTMLSLILGLLNIGWKALVAGIGLSLIGYIIVQAALISLANELKYLDDSLTPKQAHDLAAQHLQSKGDDADDTEVFLGKFIADMESNKKRMRNY
jgi:hypothetical protein